MRVIDLHLSNEHGSQSTLPSHLRITHAMMNIISIGEN